MSYLALTGDDEDFNDFMKSLDDEPHSQELDAASTKRTRNDASSRWYNFWKQVAPQVNPDQIWLDLCGSGSQQASAVRYCKAYLKWTATKTMRSRVSLGTKEREAKRTFNQASSLVSLWKSTVMAFNKTILAQKRAGDPDNAARWNLKFGTGIALNRGIGPVSEITEVCSAPSLHLKINELICDFYKWIGAEAPSMGLQREQSFVKREATSDDIALLLQVLWRYADRIPCDPITRISFHLMVLLGALGGFRPGVMQGIKYKDISMELVYDPKTKSRDLIATFTIHQNKQKAGVVREDQKNTVEISLAVHPLSLFCPASLVIARALAADAFEISFSTLDDLLHRPLFEEHIRCIRLPWKEEMSELDIFPLSYPRFWSLWVQTLLIAGYPEALRPYAIRVGAGSRLNEGLNPVLRNYLLSHTTAIYERSYQARRVKDDLIPILAPEAATERKKDLFRILRRASLRCDQLAPTEAATEDVLRWNERQDIRALSRSEDQNKFGKIRSIKHSLNRLRTKEIRQEYFRNANNLRQLGQTTKHLVRGRHKVVTATSITREISCLFNESSNSHEARYIDLLSKYLDDKHYGKPTCFLCLATFDSWEAVWVHSNDKYAGEAPWPIDCPVCQRQGRDTPLPRIKSLGEWCGHVHRSHAPSNKEPFRCLLGCKTFHRLRDRTTHLEKYHYDFWAVSKQVHCSECQCMGAERHTFTDPDEFRHHLNIHSSSKHFPPLKTPLHTCLLCGKANFGSKSALSRHTTVLHAKAEKRFAGPFHCPECRRLAQVDCLVHGQSDWSNHVAKYHGSANAPNPTALVKTQCLLCNDYLLNERAHFWSLHYEKGQFDVPFSCPACISEGRQDVRIEDCQKWQLHCAAVHGRAPHLPYSRRTERKQSRCLICDKIFSSLNSHVTKSHEARGHFDKPFPCPECARLETPRPHLIESRQAWLGHCVSVHKDRSLATSVAEEGKDVELKEEGEHEAAADASSSAAQSAGHKRAIPADFVNSLQSKRQRSDVQRGTC